MNNEKIFQLYKDGMLILEIARKLDIPYSTVMNRITHGIKTGVLIRRSKKTTNHKGRPDKKVDEKKIYEMYNNGSTFKVIADFFGVHPTTITPYVNEGKRKGFIEKKREKNNKIGVFKKEEFKNINNLNPSRRFLEFIQILTSADSISKADIKEKLLLQDSAFYMYLSELRKIIPVEYVGSIGGNAYYSIDKGELAKYFNLKNR